LTANSFGNRTAWLFPDLKTRVVVTTAPFFIWQEVVHAFGILYDCSANVYTLKNIQIGNIVNLLMLKNEHGNLPLKTQHRVNPPHSNQILRNNQILVKKPVLTIKLAFVTRIDTGSL
jgi:hypothetical protein